MARRRDLFPPDRALQARIALALVLQLVAVAATVGLAVWLVASGTVDPLLLAILVGLGAGLANTGLGLRPLAARPRKSRWLEQPFYEGMVRRIAERLALVGELDVPEIVVETEPEPLTWTSQRPFRRAKLHVTTGLLQSLDEPEVEAAIAHELGHVAHRDVTIMTVLAAPAEYMLGGLQGLWWSRRRSILFPILGVIWIAWWAAPLAIALTLSARIVSRHRELAADRAAAVLTGSPAAMAAALVETSRLLEARPLAEVRRLVPRDPFHLVPAREPTGLRRLWATHPPLAVRLERLHAMETRLQD